MSFVFGNLLTMIGTRDFPKRRVLRLQHRIYPTFTLKSYHGVESGKLVSVMSIFILFLLIILNAASLTEETDKRIMHL